VADGMRSPIDELSAPHIANVAWAFSTATLSDASPTTAQLFAALSRSVVARAVDFRASEVATVAWAFANAGHLDARLFSTLAKVAEGAIDELNDEDLDNASWAFSRAGGQPRLVKALRLRRKRASVGTSGAATDALMEAGASTELAKCGRIVVAGGGIGGAAVALALQRAGFRDVVTLESDPSFDARKQGYGLTIQGYGRTIDAMGLSLAQDDAPSTSHYTFSADGRILSFFGEAFSGSARERHAEDADEKASTGRFIHIPRQMLRKRLVEAVAPESILWNAQLEDFTCWAEGSAGGKGFVEGKEGKSGKEGDSGRSGKRRRDEDPRAGVSVRLADGRTMEAALLVGCDGIHSSVRRQLALPADRLNYVGLVVVLGIVHECAPDVCRLAQRRIFETVDGVTRIYAMPFTTTSTMWQLSFPMGEAEGKRLVKDGKALKAELLRRCADWHHPVPQLLSATALEDMSGYPIYDREVLDPAVLRRASASLLPQAREHASTSDTPSTGQPPAPERRVTLMGDAAHPMTPFKAQGANQALSDAVLLAETLAEGVRVHGPDAGIDAALPVFEQKMMSRSARMVIGSREKAKESHSSLVLQPARKVQRESKSAVDMATVIEHLRARGVADAIAALGAERDGAVAAPADARRGRAPEVAVASEGAKARGSGRKGAQDAPLDDVGHDGRDAKLGAAVHVDIDSGFRWRRAMRKQLKRVGGSGEVGGTGGGVRRKHLRTAVLDAYLRHLSEQQTEAAERTRKWCEANPAQLRRLFRERLRLARTKGQLNTSGKMVHLVRSSCH
jgi:2-polyprenyl-6-methoxyphenol hydroxylase-like FAD-dependent oxidoreductase